MSQMSDPGVALLCDLEGCSPVVYNDVAGLPTVGFGHLLTRSELASGKIVLTAGRVLRYKDGPLSAADMDALLRDDLRPAERAVTEAVKRPLMQGEFDSLVCFTFNVGVGAFRNSTLLKQLNLGQFDAVPKEMRRWTLAAGRVIEGLRRRREREVALWEGKA